MKSQSHRMSLIESITNLVVGNVLAWLMYAYAFPFLFGVELGGGKAVGVVAVFNLLSVIRSYFLRRVFNWMQGL